MNNFQYCYWLMGIFELGSVKSLSYTQVYLVKEHLNLVQDKTGFCSWLEGFFSALEEENSESLDITHTEKIQSKLRQEFLNVIDPSYSEDIQDKLQQAHNGTGVYRGVIAKC